MAIVPRFRKVYQPGKEPEAAPRPVEAVKNSAPPPAHDPVFADLHVTLDKYTTTLPKLPKGHTVFGFSYVKGCLSLAYWPAHYADSSDHEGYRHTKAMRYRVAAHIFDGKHPREL